MDTHILQGGLSLVSWRKSACPGEIPQTDRQIYVLEYKMRTKRRCGIWLFCHEINGPCVVRKKGMHHIYATQVCISTRYQVCVYDGVSLFSSSAEGGHTTPTQNSNPITRFDPDGPNQTPASLVYLLCVVVVQ